MRLRPEREGASCFRPWRSLLLIYPIAATMSRKDNPPQSYSAAWTDCSGRLRRWWTTRMPLAWITDQGAVQWSSRTAQPAAGSTVPRMPLMGSRFTQMAKFLLLTMTPTISDATMK